MSIKSDYAFKYGELKVAAVFLANTIKDEMSNRTSSTYDEAMIYDQAKRIIKLIDEQENRK